jgi:cystathionine beta-lyase/cystathionine gamma-synthase
MPCRFASAPLPAIAMLIGALMLLPTAQGADIYRWVDEDGRTHLSDVVPPQYRKSARKIDPREYELNAEQVRQAQARAERDKAQAALAQQQRASAQAAAALASGPAAAASAPRATLPAATDCATLRRLYRESQECFAPYRTATGATKAEAFEKCTPVVDPVLKCGPETSN